MTPQCKSIFFIVIFFSVVTYETIAYAQNTPPIPRDKQEVFKGLELKLEQHKQKAEQLKQKTDNTKKEISSLQKKLIPLGKKIQEQEQTLVSLSHRIRLNESEQEKLKELLNENRGQLSKNLMAALRMRRIPSETLFIQTSSPIQTAQTAMILQNTLPGIQAHMDKLARASNRLSDLQKSLLQDEQKQETVLADLREQQKTLASLVQNRQNLVKTTQVSYSETQKNIERITRESRSLQDLVSRLQAENTRQTRQRRQIESRHTPSGWPVAGSIKVRYGETDMFGAPSQGIKIQTQSKALVTTPLAGTVRYAGSFKTHGQLIIIEHSGGWHSLIGGLKEIDILVNQDLKSGEPVGTMASASRQNPPQLYYELRFKGKPVNPSRKLKNLS